MATEVAGLTLKVDSNGVSTATSRLDIFVTVSGQAEGATKKLTSSFDQLRSMLLRLAGPLAALAMLRKITVMSMEFEKSMSRVAAVSGATADELGELTQVAREMGATTIFSASQAADAMTYLAMAGFKANETIAAMSGMLDLAAAGGLGMAEAADIASNILQGFRMSAAEASRVADVMTVAFSRSNTNMMQLGDAMKYVAPVAAALSIDVEKASAAVGVLSNAGIQGSMAGTGLRRVLSALANPTTQATKVLKDLGLTVQDVNPDTNELVDVVERLANSGLTAADALTIFGDRGGPAILALTSNVGQLRELTDAMDDAEGAAKRVADTMTDNLWGSMKELESAVEELMLSLGDAGLTQTVRTTTDYITKFVNAINTLSSDGTFKEWIETNGMLFKSFGDDFESVLTSISTAWADFWDITTDMSFLEASVQVTGKMAEAFEDTASWVRLAGIAIGEFMEKQSARNKQGQAMAEISRQIMAGELKGADNIRAARKAVADQYQRELKAIEQAVGETANEEIERNKQVIESSQKRRAELLERIRTSAQEREAARLAAEEARKEREAIAAAEAANKPKTTPTDLMGGRLDENLMKLRASLRTEEEALKESYEERLDIIETFTEAESDLRLDMMKRLEEWRKGEEEAIKARSPIEAIRKSLMDEEEALRESYDERRRIVLESTQLTEEKRAELITRLDQQQKEDSHKIEVNRWKESLGSFGDFQKNMLVLARTGNKELGIIYKTGAIAYATISTYDAANSAYASAAKIPMVGHILGPIAAAAAIAAGIANVSAIASTPIGSFAYGGYIPQGASGLVGDAGPEIVHGPAMVTSTNQTKGLLQNGGKQIIVNVVNNTSGEVSVSRDETRDAEIINISVDRAKRETIQELTGQVTSGNGNFPRAMQNFMGAKRTGR